MDICDLPTEVILGITRHLSLADFSRLLLANRRYERSLSPVLYFKLPPLRSGASLAEEGTFTRMDVLQWAVGHGSLRTLVKVDEAGALEPSINSVTCGVPTKVSDSDDSIYWDTPRLLPLHLAALYGQPAIVRYFLQKGADVNATTANGFLPIHFANTGEIVEILVASGSRLDTVNGTTPLLCSLIYHADISAVAALLQLGVDPNQAADCDGRTPAQVAVDNGNVDALKLILEAGANVDRPLLGGEHLIDRAVWLARPHSYECCPPLPYSETAMEITRMLLDHGAPANSGHRSIDGVTNQPCYTPTLFLAVMFSISADLVQLLLDRGADQHEGYSETRDYLSPYHHATSGFQEIHAFNLVANFIGGLIHEPSRGAKYARLQGTLIGPESVRKLRLLIQTGGNIDAEIDNTTPLLYCLGTVGREAETAGELIPHLLDLGANPFYQDKHGNQAIHLLTGRFYSSFQQRFIIGRASASWKPLAHITSRLIEQGADPNTRDAFGRTPMMLICRQEPQKSMGLPLKCFLGRGDINVNAADFQGYTALHHVIEAAEVMHTEDSCFRLQVLLAYSQGTLDINPRDRSNHTPLHLLLTSRGPPNHRLSIQERLRHHRNKIRTLRMLVRAGGDITARMAHPPGTFDNLSPGVIGLKASKSLSASSTQAMYSSYTPLYLACVRPNSIPLIKTMLQLGAAADINAASGGLGLTPLMVVAGLAAAGKLTRNELVEAVQLLLGAGADAAMRDARGRTAWDIFLECRKTKFLWVWAPCLDGLMPEMPAEEKDKLFGLGATERSRLSRPEDAKTIPSAS